MIDRFSIKWIWLWRICNGSIIYSKFQKRLKTLLPTFVWPTMKHFLFNKYTQTIKWQIFVNFTYSKHGFAFTSEVLNSIMFTDIHQCASIFSLVTCNLEFTIKKSGNYPLGKKKRKKWTLDVSMCIQYLSHISVSLLSVCGKCIVWWNYETNETSNEKMNEQTAKKQKQIHEFFLFSQSDG